jgi:hypothetical protein
MTLKLIFVASPLPLSTPHYGQRARTDWLAVRIMWQSGAD